MATRRTAETSDETAPAEGTGTADGATPDEATDAARESGDLATLSDVEDATPENVASPADNAALEHSVEGTTTRDDALDLGVPMLPGSPDEPVGPEDALGDGPKRGDYTGRMGFADYEPTTTERIPDAKPGEPQFRAVAQRPNVENIGEVEGKKGGVETTADDAPAGP